MSTSIPDHLALAHRYKSDRSAEGFISQAAKKISLEVAEYILLELA